MDAPDRPRDALDLARQAARDGHYGEAVANYSYFFDHALDDDPASLYGVRLSYCLDEWARLGRKFPPALVALEERRREALRRLESTREPENFHDFECISKYLGVHGEAIDQFLAFHRSDSELAKSIVRFVWSKLVNGGHWQICSFYLGDPDQRYAAAVAKFDEAMTVCRANPEFGGAEFEAQIQGWLVRDVSELIKVLANSERTPDARAIMARATRDSGERGCPQVGEAISSQVAL